VNEKCLPFQIPSVIVHEFGAWIGNELLNLVRLIAGVFSSEM
jgi:hypothetical protein